MRTDGKEIEVEGGEVEGGGQMERRWRWSCKMDEKETEVMVEDEWKGGGGEVGGRMERR